MAELFSDHILNRPCIFAYFLLFVSTLLPLAVGNLDALSHAFNESQSSIYD